MAFYVIQTNVVLAMLYGEPKLWAKRTDQCFQKLDVMVFLVMQYSNGRIHSHGTSRPVEYSDQLVSHHY